MPRISPKYKWKFRVYTYVILFTARVLCRCYKYHIIFMQVFFNVKYFPKGNENSFSPVYRIEAEIRVSISFVFRTTHQRYASNSALFLCISQGINAKYDIFISHPALRWSRLSPKISTRESKRYDLS